LIQQRDILANASAISENLSGAANALSWDNANASDMVSVALEAMREAADISEEYTPLLDRLEAIKTELDDISETIADNARNMSEDPHDLEEIENRLNRIHALEAKHRVDSVEALIGIREQLSARLEALNDAPHTLKRLENEARALKREALDKATTISARRKEAASSLIGLLTAKARPLGMDNLRVDIRVDSGKLNPNGVDNVEFLFAFNKNQQPAPISSHASGGEISRVMLALKSITAQHQHLPTIIFDEVDTGVSGDVANRMGALMAGIGQHIQVLTITHLPGVAARGDMHFKVFKRDDESSTATYITRLDNDSRRSELALMLSGKADDPAALA
ncbi:MAG: DNA repair protein RecN, partial [Muribaculaceae bacterium]|nr:DNA repair protein RecN [Muribaculaceae bacterium]